MSLQVISLNNELIKAREQYLLVNSNNGKFNESRDSEISSLQSQLIFKQKQIQELSDKINSLNNELTKAKEIYALTLSRQKELENLVTLANKRADNISAEKTALINELNKELTLLKSSNTDSCVQNKAVNYDQKPIADSTKSAEDYFNIARAYQGAKDYPEAIENYKRAIAVNASFNDAYKELGLIYAQIGDYKNAGYSLKKCLYYSDNPREKEVLSNFILNIEKYENSK
jgi:tetratricopeptide (TPR) repeat protein